MPDRPRVWTVTLANGLWSFRTPPLGPKAGFASIGYRTRHEALKALRERFGAEPAYYRLQVTRHGRVLVRLVKRRAALEA